MSPNHRTPRTADLVAPDTAVRASSSQATGASVSPAPARLPRLVRELRLVQKLLRCDMERQGLSLRAAAKQGPIALGTLCHLLDERRVTDATKHPKRPTHRATLFELRSLSWAGRRTIRLINRRVHCATAARINARA